MDGTAHIELPPQQGAITLDRQTLDAAKNYWDGFQITPEEGDILMTTNYYNPRRIKLGIDQKVIALGALVDPLGNVVSRVAPELWTFLRNDGDSKGNAIDCVTLTPDRLYMLEVYLTQAIQAVQTGQIVTWDTTGTLSNFVPINTTGEDNGGVLISSVDADEVNHFKSTTQALSAFLRDALGLNGIVDRCETHASENLDSQNGANPPHNISLPFQGNKVT